MESAMGDLENLKKRLRGIYSETTIDHILNPRNTDTLSNPDGFAVVQSSHNESLKIWLRVRNDVVADSAFWTNGCAATIACGSMSTELVKGKTIHEALAITSEDIARALVDLPGGNLHCAELAAGALRLALMDCLSIERQPWKKLYRK
jgi:nitrogen fixation protein NifU and related proteins